MSYFIPQKQGQLQSLTRSLRPKTPQISYLNTIPSLVYVQNNKLLTPPIENKGLFETYKILSNISAGSQGVTYLAQTKNLTNVVIKRVLTHIKTQIQVACNTSQILSPTIPLVIDAFTEDNALFIITEAGTLDFEELLSVYHKIPQDLFWIVAQDISLAIQTSHTQNIAHLDIKPSNILIKSFKDKPQLQFSSTQQDRQENITPEGVNYNYLAISQLSSKRSIISPEPIPKQSPLINFENPLGHLISNVMLSPEPIQRVKFQEQSKPLQSFNDPFSKLYCQNFEDIINFCIFQLIDFGISQSSPFKPDSVCGDSRYLQQQFLSTGIPSFQCDCFSLGIVLFEIISGCEVPSYGLNYEKLRECNGILEVFDWKDTSQQVLESIKDLLYSDLTITQWILKYQQNFQDRDYAYNKVESGRNYIHNMIFVVKNIKKSTFRMKKSQFTIRQFIIHGSLLKLQHKKQSLGFKVNFVRRNSYVKSPLGTSAFLQDKQETDESSNFFQSTSPSMVKQNQWSTSEITLQQQCENGYNINKSTTNFEENTGNFNLTNISSSSSSSYSLTTDISNNSSFSIQYTSKKSQTVQTLLSALETITGIASMVYYQPLNFYHPTPTTNKSQFSNQCSFALPLSNKGNYSPTSTPIVEDSMLNHQVKGILRPKSGDYKILNQEELMQNGFRSITDAFVDCFEQKPQNVKLCTFLSKNRGMLFILINLLSFFIKDQISSLILNALFVLIIQRINKYNISLLQERQYHYIKNSNVYYDPIKLRSGIFGFLLPAIFIFINFHLRSCKGVYLISVVAEFLFLNLAGGFQ
ncbi:Kinase, WEE [Spironucleus salmonicida]|uniref:Kinase, WEE n=1 Tax=Spironucleus salmonicida TaxID=348837 RepID=V6LF79_9EUKA|nr:Kinase, WEE [Spironucleus salmonicida]|eukprot:EST42346.1 Kinase, WEE [Spironucleus salmonicida]